MTKLTVREYEVEDFTNIQLKDYEKRNRDGQPVDVWARTHKAAGPSFTVTDRQGEIVFCLGVHNLWPGVGELWLTTSPLAAAYPNSWIVGRGLVDMIRSGYVRLQAVVDPLFSEAMRVMEHLGFTHEGILRRYGPHGEDQVMCAAIREG